METILYVYFGEANSWQGEAEGTLKAGLQGYKHAYDMQDEDGCVLGTGGMILSKTELTDEEVTELSSEYGLDQDIELSTGREVQLRSVYNL